MKIKYPPKRLEFERFLRKLGYKNRLPITYNIKELRNEVLKDCDVGPIIIEGFIKLYPNKKCYIWECYKEILSNPRKIDIQNIDNIISSIIKEIDFKNHSRIAEIGWEVKMKHNLFLWSKHDRTKLYFKILRKFKTLLKEGEWDLKANPGDILVSCPGGLKFSQISGVSYIASKQRCLANQKFLNFGTTNEYGHQYAIYDVNLNLQPINPI